MHQRLKHLLATRRWFAVVYFILVMVIVSLVYHLAGWTYFSFSVLLNCLITGSLAGLIFHEWLRRSPKRTEQK